MKLVKYLIEDILNFIPGWRHLSYIEISQATAHRSPVKEKRCKCVNWPNKRYLRSLDILNLVISQMKKGNDARNTYYLE